MLGDVIWNAHELAELRDRPAESEDYQIFHHDQALPHGRLYVKLEVPEDAGEDEEDGGKAEDGEGWGEDGRGDDTLAAARRAKQMASFKRGYSTFSLEAFTRLDSEAQAGLVDQATVSVDL